MENNDDLFFLGIKALIRNSEGRILLLKIGKREYGYQGEAHWDIPGGRVERGEQPMDAFKREVFEETGIKDFVSIKPLTMVISNLRVPLNNDASVEHGLILSIYECRIAPEQTVVMSDEHTEMGWYSTTEAAEMLSVKYPPEFTELVKAL